MALAPWLLACPALSAGQAPLSRILSSAFEGSPGGLRLRRDPGRRLASIRQERQVGVETRERRRTTDRYIVDRTVLTLEEPFRKGLLEAQLWSDRLDGRFRENGEPAEVGGFSQGLRLASTFRLKAGTVARLGFGASEEGARFELSTLDGLFPTFGEDPPLRVTRTERRWSAAIEHDLGPRDTFGLEGGYGDYGGRVELQGQGNRLQLPLATDATSLRTTWVHRTNDAEAWTLFLSNQHGRGGAPILREGGRRIGDGTARIDASGGGVEWARRLANGSRQAFHFENAFLRFQAGGLIPRAQDTGIDGIPSGSQARYGGSITGRRTEIGYRLDRPAGPRRAATLGYRHLWAPFDLRAAYDVRLILIGLGDEARLRYRDVQLGILDFAYRFPAGRLDAEATLQQIIPYRLKTDTGSGGSPPGEPGPARRTVGGFTVGFQLTYRF